MPRPTIDDIPQDPSNRDILLEQRQHAHEWREWRSEVNGDLAFLKRMHWATVVVGPRIGAGVFAIAGTLIAIYAVMQ